MPDTDESKQSFQRMGWLTYWAYAQALIIGLLIIAIFIGLGTLAYAGEGTAGEKIMVVGGIALLSLLPAIWTFMVVKYAIDCSDEVGRSLKTVQE